MTLEPKLTPLDERVLAALPRGRPGVRAAKVAEALNARLSGWSSNRVAVGDVRGVLRGFEHLGRATGRGGWWRAL